MTHPRNRRVASVLLGLTLMLGACSQPATQVQTPNATQVAVVETQGRTASQIEAQTGMHVVTLSARTGLAVLRGTPAHTLRALNTGSEGAAPQTETTVHVPEAHMSGGHIAWIDGGHIAWIDGGHIAWIDGQKDDLQVQLDTTTTTNTTGAGITVAVIDTGVDLNHPMLKEAYTPATQWVDLVDGDATPSDTAAAADGGFGHGTAVASLVRRAAPGARILPMRVLDHNGTGQTGDVAAAILMAVDRGANVINLSLGTDEDVPAINAAVDAAQAAGVLVLSAVGNAGLSVADAPARNAGLGALHLSVSSLMRDGTSAPWNNGGRGEVQAPGEQLIAAVPGGYAHWSGSSMSTAVASGAVARALAGGLTPAQVATEFTGQATFNLH
ncbi:S8 family serine peptidase [Deinococcus maricopensis]|uniref:Peptidase S8 and S53 subtilisin kexin sedolisin n=1 Tax=Deinococcus maricopensis (strain DSM 21211 / LMG 22137 / NRRL B-23946 / LB-34) TaxID=709986 RepID=E8U4R6_DEIML|nr:S8 family serine peptidase [Deinococcus maricopensis]ADV66055.1 peptidase S8 and S53 subtilisin kexin sedolisin [Deinococcus maricopensis DSM 21211]